MKLSLCVYVCVRWIVRDTSSWPQSYWTPPPPHTPSLRASSRAPSLCFLIPVPINPTIPIWGCSWETTLLGAAATTDDHLLLFALRVAQPAVRFSGPNSLSPSHTASLQTVLWLGWLDDFLLLLYSILFCCYPFACFTF